MTVGNIREEIDKIDDALVDLFEKRFDLVEQVGIIKKSANLPVLNSAREREIVTRLTKDRDETLAGYVKTLYTILFDLSRSYQSVLLGGQSKTAQAVKAALENTPKLFPKSATVACQGIEGANSTTACEKLFQRPDISYFDSFDDVCRAVRGGRCQYGILPVENSLHGSVTAVYDLMTKYEFNIVRSVKIKINHALLANSGTNLSDIQTIYSHEQALAQCCVFLNQLDAKVIPCENTAIAAKKVAESGDKTVAAVSSKKCADLYNLAVLHEAIQNNENNYTKFICISKELFIFPGANHISLMMIIPHKPGALYQLMAKFAALGINLTKLESRPLPDRDFEFMFYFELDISVYDEALFNLFLELENGTEKCIFLGCYSEV